MAVNKSSLSAGIVIRQLLLDCEDLTAITNRIFPVAADDEDGPYVVYRRTGREGVPAKLSPGSDTVNLELLCISEDYDTTLGMAEAVRMALDSRQAEANGLRMRSCILVDSDEFWNDGAYVQTLIFNAKIS